MLLTYCFHKLNGLFALSQSCVRIWPQPLTKNSQPDNLTTDYAQPTLAKYRGLLIGPKTIFPPPLPAICQNLLLMHIFWLYICPFCISFIFSTLCYLYLLSFLPFLSHFPFFSSPFSCSPHMTSANTGIPPRGWGGFSNIYTPDQIHTVLSSLLLKVTTAEQRGGLNNAKNRCALLKLKMFLFPPLISIDI